MYCRMDGNDGTVLYTKSGWSNRATFSEGDMDVKYIGEWTKMIVLRFIQGINEALEPPFPKVCPWGIGGVDQIAHLPEGKR